MRSAFTPPFLSAQQTIASFRPHVLRASQRRTTLLHSGRRRRALTSPLITVLAQRTYAPWLFVPAQSQAPATSERTFSTSTSSTHSPARQLAARPADGTARSRTTAMATADVPRSATVITNLSLSRALPHPRDGYCLAQARCEREDSSAGGPAGKGRSPTDDSAANGCPNGWTVCPGTWYAHPQEPPAIGGYDAEE